MTSIIIAIVLALAPTTATTSDTPVDFGHCHHAVCGS